VLTECLVQTDGASPGLREAVHLSTTAERISPQRKGNSPVSTCTISLISQFMHTLRT
jgi:hypothetical protein